MWKIIWCEVCEIYIVSFASGITRMLEIAEFVLEIAEFDDEWERDVM